MVLKPLCPLCASFPLLPAGYQRKASVRLHQIANGRKLLVICIQLRQLLAAAGQRLEKIIRNMVRQRILQLLHLFLQMRQIQDVIFHQQLYQLQKKLVCRSWLLQTRGLLSHPALQVSRIFNQGQLLLRQVESESKKRLPFLALLGNPKRSENTVWKHLRLAVADRSQAVKHLFMMGKAVLLFPEFFGSHDHNHRSGYSRFFCIHNIF